MRSYNEVCNFVLNKFHGRFLEHYFVYFWGDSSKYSPYKFKQSLQKELLKPKYFTPNRPDELEDLIKLWEFIDV